MRNSYIVKILAGLFLMGCKGKTLPDKSTHKMAAYDTSLQTLTQPVNAQVIASIPVITADSATYIYSSSINGVVTYDTRNEVSIASRVSGRIDKMMIRYNYQAVKKGQLIMEVYSPDLAAAQRELLFTAKNSTEMLPGAKQRLTLLGMPAPLIEQVLRTREIIYRIPVYSHSDGYILERTSAPVITSAAPAAGDEMSNMGGGSAAAVATPPAPTNTTVLLREGQYVSAGQSLFTIYQASQLVAEFAVPPQLAAHVSTGKKLLFYPTFDKNNMQTGSVGLIEPVIRNGQNFTLLRVYLKAQGLSAGQLLVADMPVIYKGLWVPKQAVWRLGKQAIVFKQENGTYVPKEIETGVTANNMIQIKTSISDWKVAANAAYLVDSESFIKTSN